jgi:sulfofructose kinase
LQDWDIDKRLDFSCAAAAMNCMADGARGGIKGVEAIAALMTNGPRHENTWTCASPK